MRSAGGLEIQRPAVVRCRRMVPALRNRPVPWTRANLRIRDQGVCQVAGCNLRATRSLDHLQPVSRGGEPSSWTNTRPHVARMNQAKLDRTVGRGRDDAEDPAALPDDAGAAGQEGDRPPGMGSVGRLIGPHRLGRSALLVNYRR
ncbi:MAG: hypothetical protein R2710_15195 [Acidimicrobiales bacterium]